MVSWIGLLLKLPVPNVGEMPLDGRRRRHHRTDQMRPATASLPPFKIPIARRRAALPRLKDVRVHSQAHGASRLPPLEPRVAEYAVQPLLFRSSLNGLRTWDHHGPHPGIYAMPLGHAGGRPQVFKAGVRARSDKD